MRGSGVGPTPSVLITVITLLIALFVGLTVMDTISEEQLDEFEDQEDYETYCGLGCQGAGSLIGPFIVAGILAVMVTIIGGLRSPNGSDDYADTKRLYIEGEIGILELEDRLDDEMEGKDDP
jgi:hypothetical protein